MDGLYGFLVENENPGPALPCNSVSEFRQDLAVGECTTNHAIDYFESTLPTNPPKIHPGWIWAIIGTYALNEASHVPAAMKPAAMKTIVSLSQAAQDHNDQYSEYVKDVASDDGKINAVDNNNDENFAGLDDHLDDDAGDVKDEVNKSVATYATKSPDRPSCHSHEDQRLQDMKATLKNTSLMSLAKPIFESIVNTIDANAEMSLDFIEELQQLKLHYMSERHQQDNIYGSSVGIQSLPITDHATKSK
jgi:hypothetical protein